MALPNSNLAGGHICKVVESIIRVNITLNVNIPEQNVFYGATGTLVCLHKCDFFRWSAPTGKENTGQV